MSRNIPITSAHSKPELPTKSTPLIDEILARMAGQNVVENARERDKQANYLSSIQQSLLGRSSNPYAKHATVDDVVKDLQEKIGLKDYLKTLAEEQKMEVTRKIANMVAENDLFTKLKPSVKKSVLSFIDNLIETHRGMLSVPALQSDLVSLFHTSGLTNEEVENENVVRYLNARLAEYQAAHPRREEEDRNLGKNLGLDDENESTDYFAHLGQV